MGVTRQPFMPGVVGRRAVGPMRTCGSCMEMERIHQEVDRSDGSPRICDELVASGLACGRNRAARLMRAHGIRTKQVRRYRPTTDSAHAQPVAPEKRQFAGKG